MIREPFVLLYCLYCWSVICIYIILGIFNNPNSFITEFVLYLLQTFKGSPEEEGSPITIPVDLKFVPLKEVTIRIKITNEDGELKPTKAIDVSVKGCVLGKSIV